MYQQAERILKEVFGFDSFKPMQAEIIENVLRRRDTLVIMSTGGGKSICYQIPALIFTGLTVVVSPLISLMKDQVEQLAENGVPAIFLNSSLSPEEYNHNRARLLRGEVKLLYLAPEGLLSTSMLGLLGTLQIDCLTIDEAHCISEWGHDFRPEYRQLAAVRRRFPSAVCVALTATATPRVREDIKASLGFSQANEFIASFNRENLFLEVQPKTDPNRQTLEFLGKFPNQSGIIYCFSRKQVDTLSALLTRRGFSVRSYHAGLSDEERRLNQEAFVHDDVQIVVATIAFGMGINKPNVRFVIHYDMPKSIESYYQEIGRAGRDSLPAHCLLLFGYGDMQKLRYFIDQKEEAERRVAYHHLQALVRFAETHHCRRIPLLNYFGEEYNQVNCSSCDNCLSPAEPNDDLTIPAQMFLSCVKRTGETFGVHHVIDVLLGSGSQKVFKFGHQELSTYGIGKDFSKQQWLFMSRQFISQGLVVQSEAYGSLKLTPKAYDIFRGNVRVMGFLEEQRPASRQVDVNGHHDPVLLAILKEKRKELASIAGLPPYVIFSDRSLLEMATDLPDSPESLLQVHGVGAAKLAKYGEVFLTLIKKHCQDNGLRPDKRENSPSAASPGHRLRYIEVGEAYASGGTVSGMAEAFGVQPATILNHLYHYLQDGHRLPADEFLGMLQLAGPDRERVLEAFDRVGCDYLKPVYEALDERISYDDLKLMRLYYLASHDSQD